MALPDFTGQNIEDTYQRVVQKGADGQLFDGTGSAVPIKIEGSNVRISGSLIAQEYIVSSSVTNITTQQLSGSTEFGNSSDDTHTFTGTITASGNISASGNLLGGGITVNGNSTFNSNVIDLGVDDGDRINVNGFIPTRLDVRSDITSSGNISASNFIKGNQLDIATAATLGSAKVIGNLSVNGDIISDNNHIRVVAPLTASGNISSSGTIRGSNLSGTNTGDQDISKFVENAHTAMPLFQFKTSTNTSLLPSAGEF